MPKKPTHVLNLLLVPDEPERRLDDDAAATALARLRADGVLDGWRPGPRADSLIAGGFRRLKSGLGCPHVPIVSATLTKHDVLTPRGPLFGPQLFEQGRQEGPPRLLGFAAACQPLRHL